MQKFIYRILFFFLPLFFLIYSKPVYLLLDNKYQSLVLGQEVYESINKSKKRSKARKLLIGDSVGKQLFPIEKYNDTINSLACNQAIGMIGQYILLRNYLKAGNLIDTLYIVTTPFAFKNNLDQIYTFQYFAKPFYNSQFDEFISEKALAQLNKIPYISLSRDPNVLTSNWSPDFISSDKINFTFLSPISVEYLLKIKKLSVLNKFKLILLSVPVSYANKKEIENINKLEVINAGLSDLFEGYFDKIKYLNDTNYIDRVHFKRPVDFKELVSRFL